MPVATAGSAPATFEIKSANLRLVALRLKSTDLAALAEDLRAQYGDSPDFFDNDPLVIDVTLLPANAGPVDFAGLVALLRRYRMVPVAFKSKDAVLTRAALAAGLAAAPDVVAVKTQPAAAPVPAPAPAKNAPPEPKPEMAPAPSAPLPAKASRQRQPVKSWPSQLNSVSRTRSGVGRRPGLSTTGSLLRFHWPPIRRTSCGALAAPRPR